MPPHAPTMPRGLVIAAPASSQGKTTVTLGLLRALVRAGVDVASAKSGPDYIDPGYHAAATGHPCLTLDSWAAGPGQLRARLAAAAAPLVIIEGAMGLFDGAAGAPPGGAGSTQALAEALGLPVLLVVDASRMGQSVAALAAGFDAMSGRIAGIILNGVGSARHLAMLRAALGDTNIVGALPRIAGLRLPTRHLGLEQAGERDDLESFLDRAAMAARAHIDCTLVASLARPAAPPSGSGRRLPPLGQRIAVARDRAFGFAYHHMLADWRAAGAEILFFSPLADQPPDADADAVFLPGGYPELHAGRLAAAGRFAAGMRAAAERQATVYGECGGYMVLGQGVVDADGRRHAMLGLLALETSYADRARHLGYRRLEGAAGPLTGSFAGHEFHYCSTLRADGQPLFRMTDAEGTDLAPAGLQAARVFGSFAHIIECRDASA